MDAPYTLYIDRNIHRGEFAQLASLARWGNPEDFTAERVAAHFEAMGFVAHVRNAEGLFVGYISANSNGLGSVSIDSLLTHPEYDGNAIGSLLLKAVLSHFPGQPVYAMPFVDEQEVFRKEGFKVYRREMIALANRNDRPVEAPRIATSEAVPAFVRETSDSTPETAP